MGRDLFRDPQVIDGMKKIMYLILFVLFACTEQTDIPLESTETAEPDQITETKFKNILDSAGVKGSILILKGNTFYSNDFEWAGTGRLPASTFKIPNSIIALELGIMTNDSVIIPWDGTPRAQKRWEQDLTFRNAFHYSCVPCYQEIARVIGVQRMKDHLAGFEYGSMQFDTTNLDMFWLEGDSKIDQFEQINFLRSFNEETLPISKRTYEIMKRMIIIELNERYILRGKTGWAVKNDKDNCWYVGYVESKNGIHYFATNVEPEAQTPIDSLPAIRKAVTEKALRHLNAFE